MADRCANLAMLLTITSTHRPATDLGYLLAKHPGKCQTFTLTSGSAHVFYPEATADRCTAALLLDFDPIGYVRARRGVRQSDRTLAQYVNDRPYAASSFLSVAIAEVFGSALKGVSKERQELAEMSLPFEIRLAAVPCRGGESFLRALFEPLGYEVEARLIPLDETFPEWGQGDHYELGLKATVRLADLLSQLYVLIPVLDNRKHYWVGADEIDKLLEKGGAWLRSHPLREQISRLYLRGRRSLVRDALERLVAFEDPEYESHETEKELEEAQLEERISLNEARLRTITAVLKELGAARILDLGCGEGQLVEALLKEPSIVKVFGADVSMRSLERARDRLMLDRMPEARRKKVALFQASLTYRDRRFADCDAACAVEVIEHIDAARLGVFERVLFEYAKPPIVILTTPNVEYNVRFESLPAGRLRHRDHRFEWTREEFQTWCRGVADRHGYRVRWLSIGPEDPFVGAPTQMAVFER